MESEWINISYDSKEGKEYCVILLWSISHSAYWDRLCGTQQVWKMNEALVKLCGNHTFGFF